MSEPEVIDLGVHRFQTEYAPAPTPWWPYWWRRHRVLVLRWVPAALAVVLVFSLAGAADPVPPQLRQIWAVDAADANPSRFDMDRHHLYLAAPGRLAAYRLADGRVEWEAALDTSDGGVRLLAGMVIVTGSDSRSVAYDPGTGEVQWTRPEMALRGSGGQLQMLGGSTEPDAPGELLQELIDVDPRTGEVSGRLWLKSAVAYGLVEWESPNGGTYLFGLDRGGRITRIDAATLATDSVRTPHAEREPNTRQNQLRVDGGLVLATESGGGVPSLLAAYDPATLTHQWSIPGGLRATTCGSLICVNVEGEPGETVQAVDPISGEVQWTIGCPDESAVGEWCIGPSVQALEGGDRLWVSVSWQDHAGAGTTSWVADAGTGQRLTHPVQGWILEHRTGDSGLLLGRLDDRAEWRLAEGEPYLVWWARSDVRLDPIELLGAVETHGCGLQYPHLICWTEGQGLAVWRFDS